MLKIEPRAAGVEGSPAYIVVQSMSPDGGYEPAEGQFDGTETLLCEVWPGSDRAVTATLPVAWFNGQVGEVDPPPDYTRLKIEFPLASMTAMEPGRYLARVTANAGDYHLADFAFVATPGPGSAVARVVYHTYKRFRDECPADLRLAMNEADETQFNDLAGEARDWIDGRILDKAKSCSVYPSLYGYRYGYGYDDAWWSTSSPYAVALAADGLDLTTVGGKRIALASVFYTLSILMRRGRWVTNAPEGMEEAADDYEDRAMRTLRSATADFADSYSLASIKLDGGRLVR